MLYPRQHPFAAAVDRQCATVPLGMAGTARLRAQQHTIVSVRGACEAVRDHPDGWRDGWKDVRVEECGERMATAKYETSYAVRPGRCRSTETSIPAQTWHYVARRRVHATTDATWCHAAANNCLTPPPSRTFVLRVVALMETGLGNSTLMASTGLSM